MYAVRWRRGGKAGWKARQRMFKLGAFSFKEGDREGLTKEVALARRPGAGKGTQRPCWGGGATQELQENSGKAGASAAGKQGQGKERGRGGDRHQLLQDTRAACRIWLPLRVGTESPEGFSSGVTRSDLLPQYHSSFRRETQLQGREERQLEADPGQRRQGCGRRIAADAAFRISFESGAKGTCSLIGRGA